MLVMEDKDLSNRKRVKGLKLLNAARFGNESELDELLEDTEANILEVTTTEENTALHMAARYRNKQLVEKIVKGGRESLIFKSNLKGETPVHIASRAGKDEVVDYFIDSTRNYAGIYIGRIRDNFGNTPLHGAVRNKHLRVLNSLANEDNDSLLCINDAGESPLSIAIDMRWTNIATAIINLNQSTLDYRGHNGQTPLHLAVLRNNFEIVHIILGRKMELVEEPDERKRTPLHYAASLGHLQMVEALIKADAFVAYTRDENNQIPLHLAAEKGQLKLMKELLKSSPYTIEMVDKQQQNVVHLAAKNGNSDVVKYLLKRPEMEDLVNSPDVEGNTPLHFAAMNFHSLAVSALSRNSKVDIRAINNSNRTALAIVKLSDDRGMELQKHLTLKALKSAYTERALNLDDDILESTEFDDDDDKQPVKPSEVGKKGKEMAQMISIMSTLIATFTFTAAFTIPGGLNSDGPHKGMAVLISKSAFQTFVISDAIAMTSSLSAAVLVFWSSSRRDNESFLDTLPFAIGLTWISLMAMALAFVTGLFVVLQKTLWLAILVCFIGCAAPVCLYILAPLYLFTFAELKSPNSLSNRQNIVEDNPFLFIVRLVKIVLPSQISGLCRCLRPGRSKRSSCMQ